MTNRLDEWFAQQAAGGGLAAITQAVEEHDPSHVFGLFSGGHDSVTATALAAQHPRFTGAFHVNTGTGIRRTLQYVRDTAAARGWALIEKSPPEGEYRRLVLKDGFPSGPQSHNSMYWYLKQKQINALVREHKVGRTDRIVLVTGIRRQESTRRAQTEMAQNVIEREGAKVWVNPILDWTARDVGDFMEAQGIPRNPVVDLLHRSGECLCGALAHREEIKAIDFWFPEEAGAIHALEREAQALDLPCRWATPTSRRRYEYLKQLRLCSSCQLEAFSA